MGKLNIVVDDKIDDTFRKEVFKRKGMKKGNITEAVEEAIILWVSSGDEQKNIKEKVK
jgi:hypothetical protein